MSIITPSPWAQQPQTAVGIDWSNPATRGLVGVWDVPSKSASLRNLAGGSAASVLSANGASYSVTPKGVALYSNNTGAGIDLFSDTRWPSGNAFTFIVEVLQASNGCNIIITGTGGVSLAITAGGYVQFDKRNAVAILTSSRTVTAGRFNHIAVTYDGTNAACYINGSAAGTASNTQTLVKNSAYMGYAATASATFSQPLAFNRALSPSEIKSLSDNPWQIFAPLRRNIYVDIPAATGDGSATASLSTITLTAPDATATGTGTSTDGNASGALGTVTLTSPSAAASGSGLATVSFANATLTAPAATAVGSAVATAALQAMSLTAPTGAGLGDATATVSFGSVTLTAPTGMASSAGDAIAVGSVSTITLTAPIATANATQNATATTDFAVLTLTAPTGAASSTAAAIARPTADTSAGSWLPSTPGSLYAMLDEVSPDDNDYIYANSATTCEIALNAVADPGTTSGQVVSYTAWSPSGNGLIVRLKQNSTTIAEWTHAAGVLPTTVHQFDQSLSAAECNAITDYAALSITFEST